MKKKIIIIFFLLLEFFSMKAYQSIIQVSIDSTKIMIGEQTKIRLKINTNENQAIKLPILQNTLIDGIEVISISKPDTVHKKGNKIQIRYNYTVTSFDSDKYILPSFPLIIGRDTFYSNKLSLLVSSPVLKNKMKNNFYSIKNILSPKYIFFDYLYIVWYAIGICIILFFVYFLKNRQKTVFTLPNKIKKSILPHILAIQDLNKIEEQQLWQQGKEKEYYSKITDVIRRYIYNKFNINAMEMTSKEILNIIKFIPEIQSVLNNIEQLFHFSDLVKFAKYCPLKEENKLSITNAFSIIKKTASIEILEK